jgi:Cu+-exporting ATPase
MQDPVCGMQIEGRAAASSEYQGRRFEFCSTECKQQFDQDPERYARKSA